MRVLIVSESSAERMRAATGLLASDDVEVVEADGAPAVRARDDIDGFDVLVIDGDLQPRGGFSLLYEIRSAAELDEVASPPALVMMDREQDRWLGGWAGANEVMLKPVDPFRLAAVVRALHGQPAAVRDPYGNARHSAPEDSEQPA